MARNHWACSCLSIERARPPRGPDATTGNTIVSMGPATSPRAAREVGRGSSQVGREHPWRYSPSSSPSRWGTIALSVTLAIHPSGRWPRSPTFPTWFLRPAAHPAGRDARDGALAASLGGASPVRARLGSGWSLADPQAPDLVGIHRSRFGKRVLHLSGASLQTYQRQR